jgi:AAA ATPase-like protein
MLTELSLHQYRAHAATRIPLERLCVLIGPNAVGKSSALEALFLLGRLLSEPAEKVFVGGRDLRWLVRRGASEPMKIHVAGSRQGVAWSSGSPRRRPVTWRRRGRRGRPTRLRQPRRRTTASRMHGEPSSIVPHRTRAYCGKL